MKLGSLKGPIDLNAGASLGYVQLPTSSGKPFTPPSMRRPRCEYCDTALTNSLMKCPNCGAGKAQ